MAPLIINIQLTASKLFLMINSAITKKTMVSMGGSEARFLEESYSCCWWGFCIAFLGRDGFRAQRGTSQEQAGAPRDEPQLPWVAYSHSLESAAGASTGCVATSFTGRGNKAKVFGFVFFFSKGKLHFATWGPLPCDPEHLPIPDGPPPLITAHLFGLFGHFHLKARSVIWF